MPLIYLIVKILMMVMMIIIIIIIIIITELHGTILTILTNTTLRISNLRTVVKFRLSLKTDKKKSAGGMDVCVVFVVRTVAWNVK
jgi:hypothetical protein